MITSVDPAKLYNDCQARTHYYEPLRVLYVVDYIAVIVMVKKSIAIIVVGGVFFVNESF